MSEIEQLRREVEELRCLLGEVEAGDKLLVEAATSAERERCARIAERFAVANLVDEEATNESSVAQSIANTIRMTAASEAA